MRIAINGWFHGHLATGSGQYLDALAEWLPRVASGHEFIMIRRCGEDEQEQQGGNGARRQANTQHRATPQVLRYAIRNIYAPTPFDRINANLAKLWFEQVTFPRACRRLHADVAFVPYWGSPWWRPCPVVVTVHDLIPLLLPLYRGGTLQRRVHCPGEPDCPPRGRGADRLGGKQARHHRSPGHPGRTGTRRPSGGRSALPACHRSRRSGACSGQIRPA